MWYYIKRGCKWRVRPVLLFSNKTTHFYQKVWLHNYLCFHRKGQKINLTWVTAQRTICTRALMSALKEQKDTGNHFKYTITRNSNCVREASRTVSLRAEHCENLFLFAMVPCERHSEIPPASSFPPTPRKKIAGTVNNNPQIIQMGKHFQNWLYKVLLTGH